MFDDGEGFGAELFEPIMENIEIFVVGALAAVVEDFGLAKTVFDIGFGNI